MKRSWMYIVTALALSTLALSACGKKGGGGTAAPPTASGNGNPPPPGQPTQIGRGIWQGRVDIVDPDLAKDFLIRSHQCSGGSSCRFTGAYLTLRLDHSTLPGRGGFRLQTYRNNAWKHTINKYVQALPLNNGFQLVYNLDGGGWSGWPPGGWQQTGGQHCYWRQVRPQQRRDDSFWIGGHVNINGVSIGGQYQQGFSPGQAQWVCEDSSYVIYNHQAHGQQAMGPQVIDPQQSFWIGHQVQTTAEFKDASKTCIVVRVYFKGQLLAQGELVGTVF